MGQILKDHEHHADIYRNMAFARGLKLPAEPAGNFYPSLAACSVGLAITVAANLALVWLGANEVQEVSMEKMVHRKMARISVLSFIEAVGTATIGGLLAA